VGRKKRQDAGSAGPFDDEVQEGDPEGAEEGRDLASEDAGAAAEDYTEAGPGAEDSIVDATTAENRKDPKLDEMAREAKMAGGGTLPELKLMAKRVTPEFVLYDGMKVMCRGQSHQFDGQFTKDEMEAVVRDHFGGGRIRVAIYNLDIGKIVTNKWYEFPGAPNMRGIIDDLFDGDATRISGVSGQLSPVKPPAEAAPATVEDRELKNAEAALEAARKRREAARLAKLKLAEDREAQREVRDLEAEEEKIRQEEEDRQHAEACQKAEEMGLPQPMHPRALRFEFPPPQPGSFRRPGGMMGRGGFGRQREEFSLDDPERPMTQRELTEQFQRQRETDQLRDELRQMREELRRREVEPKTDTMAMVTQMMGTMQQSTNQLIAAIINANKQGGGENERWMTLFKLMADSNKQDRTVDMVIKAAGLQDDRKTNEMATMQKMLELGVDLGRQGGGDDEGGEWWHGPLRGVGDILTAAASRLGIQQAPPPQQVRHHAPTAALPVPGQALPQARPPLPPPVAAARAALPVPGQAGPQIQAAPMQGTPVVRLPGADVQGAQQAMAQEESESMSSDDQIREAVALVMEQMLDQAETKPAEPEWVDAAFATLPFEMLKAVAESENYDALIGLFKPYADLGLGARLMTRVQTDKRMAPWLVMGYEQLRDMAQDQVDKMEPEPEPEPESPPEPVKPAAAVQSSADGEAEPVVEEGIEGGKADARK
jgi:hypothetical protein